jgi:hypothetical protein
MERTIFVLIVVICAIGLIIEVFNPHSFLGTTRALMQSLIFVALLVPWLIYTKKVSGRYAIKGAVVLFLTACAYFYYGLSSFCQNTYFEQIKANQHSDNYSCVQILKEQIL